MRLKAGRDAIDKHSRAGLFLNLAGVRRADTYQARAIRFRKEFTEQFEGML